MNLNTLYKKYIENGLSNDFWGSLPKKLDEIGSFIKIKKEENQISDKTLNSIKDIVKDTHKKYGVYNEPIKNLLTKWDPQTHVVEIGHQPLYFGGGSFIFNKISFTIGLAQYLIDNENLNAIPLLFLGDHDQVQNELTITRFPQTQSASGLELKSDEYSKTDTTPIAYLAKPSETELLNQFEKIRSNYRELFRSSKIKGTYRPLLEERLENSLTLLYDSYLESKFFGDWIGRFWSKFFNLISKSPLLVIKASDPKLRNMLGPYLELLLKEKNRIDLIRILNNKNEEIRDLGFKPGLSLRNENESPFFYECPDCTTRNRIKIVVENSKLVGKCEICRNEISIQYDKNSPDLSEHYTNLSPRVESRSIILNQLIYPTIRVTGGGETTYHAQIIPYLREKNLHYPLILKHPRVYYNSPWSEKTSSAINFDKLIPLQNSETFKRMTEISKEKEYEPMQKLINENEVYLSATLNSFESAEQRYLENPKNKQNSRKLNLVQLYLSHAFGKYQNNKTIQEISWNWMDLGILTGNDLVGFYTRRLKPNLPIAPTFWLSAGQFN